MTLTYDDPRSRDRYEIEIDPDSGLLLHALRFVDKIGRDPIPYDSLAAIPQPHRSLIEQKIWTLLHPTRQ